MQRQKEQRRRIMTSYSTQKEQNKACLPKFTIRKQINFRKENNFKMTDKYIGI